MLHENQKVSPEKESHESFESEFDDNELYHIANMSLEYTQEKIEWRKCVF